MREDRVEWSGDGGGGAIPEYKQERILGEKWME